MNTSILESKLKRLRISFFKKDGKIIIAKPTIDYITLIGLVALPIIAAACICILLIFYNIESITSNQGKIIAGIVFLFGTGFFNLSRVNAKK